MAIGYVTIAPKYGKDIMTAPEEILVLARREIGTVESPPQSNRVRYADWYGVLELYGSYQPWCAVFICWLLDLGGIPLPKIQHKKGFAYCPYGVDWFKNNARWHSKNPKPGDIVFFDWGKDGKADHVGIVEEVFSTYIKTIEGNTSTFNQSNGGSVMRRTRYYGSIQGYGRPDYDYGSIEDRVWNGQYLEASFRPSFSSRVVLLQKKLNSMGADLKVDGHYGKRTEQAVKEVQQRLGLEADGVVGPKSWDALFSKEKATC